MAAKLILEVEHVFSQDMTVYLIKPLSFPVLAYLVVLAIDTPHIAVSKEYRSRTPAPGKGWLLTVVSTE